MDGRTRVTLYVTFTFVKGHKNKPTLNTFCVSIHLMTGQDFLTDEDVEPTDASPQGDTII